MTKAVFLDRDGVINQKPKEGEYVTSWDGFHILPGTGEAIAILKQAGYVAIVVTNQRCVAKGLLTTEELEKIHQQMSQELRQLGAALDGIYYCPHDYEASCSCRKPAPGMLLKAASERGLDIESSWMVGDSDVDILAGKNAGCRTALVVPQAESSRSFGSANAQIVATSLLDAARQILEWDVKRSIEFDKRKITA